MTSPPIEGERQPGVIEGLGNEAQRLGGRRACAGFRVRERAEHERGNVEKPPDLDRRIDAITIARHADIHQDEVGPQLVRQGYGTLCGASKTNHLVARLDHRRLDVHGDEHLVLDDENAAHSRRGVRHASGVGILRIGASF